MRVSIRGIMDKKNINVNVTGKDIQKLECFEDLLSFDLFTTCISFIQGVDTL